MADQENAQLETSSENRHYSVRFVRGLGLGDKVSSPHVYGWGYGRGRDEYGDRESLTFSMRESTSPTSSSDYCVSVVKKNESLEFSLSWDGDDDEATNKARELFVALVIERDLIATTFPTDDERVNAFFGEVLDSVK